MVRLDALRSRISPFFVIALGLAVAPLFGVAIATALRGQVLYLFAIGGALGVAATVLAPIELLVLGSVLGVILADTRFLESNLIYYARFVPIGMLAVRTLLDVSLRRFHPLRVERSFLLPGLAFVLLAAISISYSLLPEITFQRTLSMALVVIAFGLGLPNYLANEGKLFRLLHLVVILIGAIVLLGAVFAGTVDNSVSVEQSFVRVSGFFANPNTQGLMAMLVFFPLVWWWRTETKGSLKTVLGALVVVWGGLVLLAGSRGSLLGVVGGGVALIVLYGRGTRRYLVLIAALLVGAVLLEVALPEFGRALLIEDTERPAQVPGGIPVVDRPYLIQRGIELGMRSPIWGVGFTASDKIFDDDRPYLVSQGVYISGSHNSYTRLFVDLGVIGLVVALPIFAIILGRVYTAPPALKRDTTVAFLTAAVIAGLINSFFEGWLFGFGNSSTIPFWLFLAMIPIRMTQLREQAMVTVEPALQLQRHAEARA